MIINPARYNTGYIFMVVGILSFLAFGVLYLVELKLNTGPFLIFGFIMLAIAVRWFQLIKGFSYSLWIFAAVAVSMYYPEFF